MFMASTDRRGCVNKTRVKNTVKREWIKQPENAPPQLGEGGEKLKGKFSTRFKITGIINLCVYQQMKMGYLGRACNYSHYTIHTDSTVSTMCESVVLVNFLLNK
jgi:hypothetical protein